MYKINEAGTDGNADILGCHCQCKVSCLCSAYTDMNATYNCNWLRAYNYQAEAYYQYQN